MLYCKSFLEKMYANKIGIGVSMPPLLMRVIFKTGLFTNLGSVLYPVVATAIWIITFFFANDVILPLDARYYYI